MKTNRISALAAFFSLFVLLLPGCGDSKEVLPVDPPTPVIPESAYDLENFPENADPRAVGTKLVERFIEVRHSYWGNINSDYTADHITYPDVCAWLGALWFADHIGDEVLWNRVADKFDLLFTTESHLQPNLKTTAGNKVDYYVFGAIPLNIYQKRKDPKYLELGLKYADGQYTLPTNASAAEREWHNKGYSWQTRLWIDDMFMITALQAQAYLATGDKKYIERAAKGMALYLDELQRDNGLFYHAPTAPFYWARGNGWMAVGMPEVLRILPADAEFNVYRDKIMAGYQKMMNALEAYQVYNGMWAQLIDSQAMWKETSGTAMFTYGMITGVKKGWLDKKKYGTAARKAWIELQNYLTADYDLTEVCEGTGTQNSYNWYKDRRRWVGDMHGQAGMLWSAYALCWPSEAE